MKRFVAPLRFSVWGMMTALVILGVFRRELPDSIREHWSAWVVSLAWAGAVLNLARARFDPTPERGQRVLLSIFFVALAAMFLQPQRVASDGIFYFAPLRSLVVDGDLDFENEYRVLGAREGYFHPTATGKLPNNYSIGPAIVWTPFYLIVHGVGLLGLFRPTGFGYPYFTASATATAIGGFLGVLWFYRLARGYYEDHVALSATVFLWLGSFHIWYMVFEPSMSHALAMATVSGLFLFCRRGLEGWRAFALAGVAAGFVMLVRWQNVIFLPVGLALSWSKKGRPRWEEMAVGAAAAVLVFLPQMIYWKIIYGQFLLVPQGGSYMQWASPEIEAVLFSSRHGLLSWSPVLWIGAFGFIGVIRKKPILGWSLLGAFVVCLYVNASVYDWWAGASFGARRFDGALPAFGLGLAAALAWSLRWIRKHPLAMSFVVATPFLVWNFLLMGLLANGSIPHDGAVSFQQAGADGLEMIYRRTGYPFSWPGAIAERLRSGLSPPVYDLVSAKHPSNNVEIRMGSTDGLHLGSGWSLTRRGAGQPYREGTTEGSYLYVALRDTAPYRLLVDGFSSGEVTIAVNGLRIGVVALPEGKSAVLEIPPQHIVTGINEIRFSSRAGTEYSISRVKLSRPGGD